MKRQLGESHPRTADMQLSDVTRDHQRSAHTAPEAVALRHSYLGLEPPRLECAPSILGRLARHGEDAELQRGDQGEGGPAGP